jgi:pyruvate dehydrogenase E2 component (dihydrolipoamide acetyltransferase)
MATEVKVPTTGNAGEAAVVLEWNVSVGSEVSTGDVLGSLETAKSALDVEAPVSGSVLEILVAEGEEAPEHSTLMLIGAPGEADSAGSPAGQSPPKASAGPVLREAPPTVRAPRPDSRTRVNASPRARRIAAERGIDLASLDGSGPFGRIVIRDVPAAAPDTHPSVTSAPSVAASSDGSRVVPVRGARKVTARRMQASLQEAAQVTLTRYAPADALVRYAARLKEVAQTDDRPAVSINDLLLFATARTVGKHPALNAWFDWDGITQFSTVHLGVAVDTGKALLVPVILQADTLTLGQLSAAARSVITRARDSRIEAREMEGGTFTVSNLGGLGVHWFTPVLNPPQAGILGVGAVHRAHPDAPAVLPLSLTFDHRAIDGAAAAAALRDIAHAVQTVDTLAAF